MHLTAIQNRTAAWPQTEETVSGHKNGVQKGHEGVDVCELVRSMVNSAHTHVCVCESVCKGDGQQMSEEGLKRNGARGCDKDIAYVRPLNLEHRCTFACISIMLYERLTLRWMRRVRQA